MSILITGSNGFVGRYVVDYFLSNTPYQIYCVDLQHSDPIIHERIHYSNLDLLEPDFVREVVREKRPRKILHLAGLPSVGASIKDPYRTFQVNIFTWLNLLEAVRLENLNPRILFVSSSEVYGAPESDNSLREEGDPLKPETPYATTKAACELMARQYGVTYGFKITIARSFNHSGPGQSDTFVLSALAKRLMEIKVQNREPVLYTGNIEVERDFLDVRDVVRAYAFLLEKGKPGEAYNVCSGGALPLRWMLEELIRLADVTVEVRTDMNLVRKYDIPMLAGSCAKLAAETSWKPEIALTDTLRNLLEYWHNKLVQKQK